MRHTPGHVTFRTLELPNFRTSLRGFTLIETALAMLAIGLGLLALFGLGRLGLQSTKETGNDQRCAMMADAIFETLREYNARFVDEARTNNVPGRTWTELWENVALNRPPATFPEIASISKNVTTLHFWQKAENDLYNEGKASPTPAFDPDNISLSDWNPRYILYVSAADTSPVAQDFNMLQFTLKIFPDGDTYSSEYRLFRTTLTNPGGLP